MTQSGLPDFSVERQAREAVFQALNRFRQWPAYLLAGVDPTVPKSLAAQGKLTQSGT
jgi:hypothetical protein